MTEDMKDNVASAIACIVVALGAWAFWELPKVAMCEEFIRLILTWAVCLLLLFPSLMAWREIIFLIFDKFKK